MPTFATKIASRAVRAYPFARGKHRLRQFAAKRFLTAKTEFGCWVRISGVSGFDWKVFDEQISEPVTAAAIKALLRPGMTVFDVGANVGYFTLLAARLVGSGGRVHAFEPTPSVAHRLAENVAMNKLESQVCCNAVAVGDEVGVVSLHTQRDDSEGNNIFSDDGSGASISVPVLTLDAYITDHSIKSVDVMKLDVEGAEIKVLAGANSLLSRADSPILIAEANPSALRRSGGDVRELCNVCSELGYRVYGLEQLTAGQDPVYNVLAAKPVHEGIIRESRLSLENFPAA
jgi:FkbM family methyltransferase